ncbi:(2Fe-2S)-binding protein [Arsenicicoccus sp. oral taxon 190]|uniref:(2Fe-2S)-binding protein n=1 Tax=Arsenicicoccus sp. oral taxon 190 TaxID=1658671 RepID=UPI000679F161|nr:(2Fe-2S)-binding protein [Arsenicicoccus sp. oral taxon 190]AKT51177.1 hypothetical protein ADJ73_07360 [Arsenicicoccus sp. oral taxon 190]
MAYPLAGGELELACDLVSTRIAWLDLTVAPGDAASGTPHVDTAAVAAGTERGLEQLAAWRERVARGWRRTYAAGSQPPPHVAATFVLGWYLDALAYPAALAAEVGPWVLDVAPGALVIEPHPTQGYPHRVRLAPGAQHQVVAAAGVRRARAEQRYREHAERVAGAYAAPGVRMSSRQRLGMVDDVWHLASRQALAAAGSPIGDRPQDTERDWLRASCCFIYALPGASVCIACPRRVRRGIPSTTTTPGSPRPEE